jgi:vacuolar-type H+-ATPase subunit E/Vma4
VATLNQNAPDILCAEILADARHESEAIIHRAQREVEVLLAHAAAEADTVRQERLEQARAEAVRRKELTLAAVPVETGRLRLARVEELLQSVREEVARRLLAREGFDYRETVIALAVVALKQMPGSAFVVQLSATDCSAFGDCVAEEIARRVGRSPLNITIAKDTGADDDVLIIQDAESRLVWDNCLSTRLERLWPELRRQIAMEAALVSESRPAGGGA